jgi:GT2 family glycosyltransferase/lipopolysaccharide/colanic/teichoic acid biosynthesis glycosyltransferase|tara:strand:- start:2162 stop:4222 length:2061 start_codon:yes stop_codon:yes gene_type:complete
MEKVSVIIISYNVRSYLAHAIDAIMKSDYEELEIIVVDNNSYDGTCEYLKENYNQVSSIHVISNNENVGFGRAVNQAGKVATGEYYLILNPDTIIEEETISVLVNYLYKNKNVGMVGPKILNADGTLQLACKRSFPTIKVALPKILGLDRIFPNSKWAGKYNLTYLDPEKIASVDAISGSCMLASAETFNRLNGFDEQFFMFGEDLDLCARIWGSGQEVHYVPETKIVHYKGESVKTAPYDSREAFYHSMNIYVNKHFSSTLGLFTRFFIAAGISLKKFISAINEKRSLFVSVSLDMLVIIFAFIVAINFRFSNLSPIIVSKGLVPMVYVLLWITVGSLFQLYSRYILSYSRALIASVSGFLIAVLFTYFFKQYAYSRLVIIIASSIIVLFIPGWRVLLHYLISRGYFRSVRHPKSILFSRKSIIAGADSEGVRIAENIIKRFDSGLDLVGFVDHKCPSNHKDLPIPFIGSVDELRQITDSNNICEVIFSTSAFTNKQILNFMDSTRDLRLIYRMVPHERDILLGKTNIEDIGGISFVNIEYNLFYRLHRISKRIFDLIFSSILLFILSPIIIGYYILGKVIQMSFWGENSSTIDAKVFDSNNKLIRDTPLLISVFFGDISLVGSSMIESSENNPNLLCQPGITGLERIRNVKFDPDIRRAVEHYYIQNQNLKLDLEIIIKTLLNG